MKGTPGLRDATYAYDGRRAAALLSRERHALDAGDNRVVTRTAPASTSGIAAPEIGGRPALSVVSGDASFAAVPKVGESHETYTGLLSS